MDLINLYSLFLKYPNITTDSRNIVPGSFYFALRGDKFDGNLFAREALDKGAAFAVIDRSEYNNDNRIILVDDTLETLQQLALHHRRMFSVPVIAITGTNGKTTTKELIKAVLSTKYNTLATSGNLNNHIGVPLTLLSINTRTEIAVVEMGANHPLEIKFLCSLAEPTHGIITNIGKAHLEGFGGFQGVIKTKKELYDFLSENKKTIFYNADNNLLNDLLEPVHTEKISYGIKAGKHCQGTIISGDPFLTMEIKGLSGNHDDDAVRVNSNLAGVYNAENILAACCIGLHFGLNITMCAEAIAKYTPSNNRSQIKETKYNKLLLDCYNANPSSTEAALLDFSKVKAPSKTIILGDMLELGEDAVDEHTHMIEIVASIKDSDAIFVGDYYLQLAKFHNIKAFANVQELISWLKTHPIQNSYILIKGSRGIQLEKAAELL